MIVELKHSYLDLKTEDFVANIEIAIEDTGICVFLEVRDYEEPDGEYLDFHGFVPWDLAIKEGMIGTVDAVRFGPNGPIDIDNLAELRDKWLATIAKFNEGVDMLSQLINEAKAIELRAERLIT